MKLLAILPTFLPAFLNETASKMERKDAKIEGNWWIKKEDVGDECDDIPFSPTYYGEERPRYQVAVHELQGAVRKNWWYGSTTDLLDDIKCCEEDSAVLAHVLCIDSGGGEASHVQVVADYIRYTCKKPTLVYVNGYCCSAAYFIAAAANKIYCSTPTDITGSIGVVISFADFTKYYEKLGIVEHTVYATQSEDKNKDFTQALKGEYDLLKANLLDPFAENFIKKMQEYRTITDDGHVWAGKTYMAEASAQIGLIDGIKTYEEVIAEAIILGKQNLLTN